MYKASAKDIKWLTQSEFSEEVREAFGDLQPQGVNIAYYAPSTANWSYIIMITMLNGKTYEVVTRFGSVEGGREINLKHYDEWNTSHMEA